MKKKKKIILSICLVCFLVVGTFILITVFNKPNNPNDEVQDRLTFTENIDEENAYYFLNSSEEYKESRLVKNEEVTQNSSYSYEWSNHSKNPEINLNKLLTFNDDGYVDINKYDTLVLDMYSKEKTNSSFVIAFFTDPYPQTYTYYRLTINIDFEGWQRIKINFVELENANNPDMSKVKGVSLFAIGWGMTPNDDDYLCFDKIFLTKMNYTFNLPDGGIQDSEYDKITNSLKDVCLLNDANINSDILNKRLNDTVSDAKRLMTSFNKNGLPFDSQMKDSSEMTFIYSKVYTMSLAYDLKGYELYHSQELLDDVIYALDYMDDNYYSKRGNVFKSGFDNSYDWEIGSPTEIIKILCLLKNSLSNAKINKYLNYVNQYDALPNGEIAHNIDVGYICVFSAALQKDYKKLAISIEMMRKNYEYVEYGNGFYEDGSFIYHSNYAYVGGYGSELLEPISKVTYCLRNTCFRLDGEIISRQYDWVINSFLPLMYNGAYFDFVRGRSVGRTGTGLYFGNPCFESICLMTSYLNDLIKCNYLKSIIKNWYAEDKDFFNGKTSILPLSIALGIDNDKTISVKKINDFAKVYANMDKVVSQVNGVGIGVSMSSSRIGKFEAMNWENRKGWYEGDGMTYIYLSPNDYAYDYWSKVNYYRLPGTTITSAPREEKNFSVTDALGNYDFVGGTYLGTNSVSGMRFKSEAKKIGFNSTLEGNKGYFTFDDKIVCLGNNISSSDSYNTETIIENRYLTGKFYIGNNEVTNKSGYVNSNYIYIENYGGIYIPDYTNVKYNITSNNFLEIYFDHGTNFNNLSYAYILLPNVAKDNLTTIASQFKIISNDKNYSAISYKGISEYIVWDTVEQTSFNNFSVSKPCAFIVSNDEIALADPTQKLKQIELIFDLKKYIFETKNGLTSKIKR